VRLFSAALLKRQISPGACRVNHLPTEPISIAEANPPTTDTSRPQGVNSSPETTRAAAKMPAMTIKKPPTAAVKGDGTLAFV
jgi:hypothetical protein